MKEHSFYIRKGITQKSRPNYTRVTILSLILIGLSIYAFFSLFSDSIRLKKTKLISPVNENLNLEDNKTIFSIFKKKKEKTDYSFESLSEELGKVINDKKETYSIYFYDFKNNKAYGINEDTVMIAASVNKIPILASLYHLVDKQEIDLEKSISIQRKDIQNYGTGVIRYDKPGTSYSIKTLARLMMEKSDNTAAYVLGTHIIGIEKIQNLIEFWGLTQTDMKNNKTSVKDMFILLEKMYHEKITSPSLTSEMLGFMDKSDFDDRLPQGLEEGITIYHKTGDEVGKVHDVGIIDLKDNPYFLGILTTDVKNAQETKKTLAQVSKVVYEFVISL